jgi:N-acetyl sugar amidotransferase
LQEKGGRAVGAVIQYCKKCVTPNTRPRINFNEEGVCNACLFAEKKKQSDWEAKEQALKNLVAECISQAKERQYDCVIPVSGGKDSHYQTYYAKNLLLLNPLCVTFTPFMPTEVGKKNLRNLIEAVGVDHISITPNPQIYAKLTRIMLEEHGDPFKPFLYGVFSGAARVAAEKKVPLFLYGENGETEYGGSEDGLYMKLDTKGVHARIQSDRAKFKTPEEWVAYEIPLRQLTPFLEPPPEQIQNVRRIFMADYLPWNNNHHLHVALNVIGGFTLSETRTCGTYTHGSGIDDYLDEIYLWLTWPKFGYGRSTKYAAKDIREGKLTRERAKELIRLYDGEFPWHMFEMMLELLDMTESDFWAVVERHIGDEQNIQREWEEVGNPHLPKKVQAWEKIGPYRWRHLNPIHGGERILELPLKRPSQSELEKLKISVLGQPPMMEPARGYQPVPGMGR